MFIEKFVIYFVCSGIQIYICQLSTNENVWLWCNDERYVFFVSFDCCKNLIYNAKRVSAKLDNCRVTKQVLSFLYNMHNFLVNFELCELCKALFETLVFQRFFRSNMFKYYSSLRSPGLVVCRHCCWNCVCCKQAASPCFLWRWFCSVLAAEENPQSSSQRLIFVAFLLISLYMFTDVFIAVRFGVVR